MISEYLFLQPQRVCSVKHWPSCNGTLKLPLMHKFITPWGPSHPGCLPVYQQPQLGHTGLTEGVPNLFQRLQLSLAVAHQRCCPPKHSPTTSVRVALFDPKCCHSSAGRKSNCWQLKCLCSSKSVRIFNSPRQAQDISNIKQLKKYTLKPSTGRQLSSVWPKFLEPLGISGPATSPTCSLRQQDEDVSFFVQIFQHSDWKPTEMGVIQ